MNTYWIYAFHRSYQIVSPNNLRSYKPIETESSIMDVLPELSYI